MNFIKKVLSLLNQKEKRNLFSLFPLMLFVGIIQTFSIISVFPFISVVSNPSIVATNPILKDVYDQFQFGSVNQFLIFLGSLVLAFVVISNAATVLSNYYQIRFSSLVFHNVGSRLLKKYLYQPYVFFLDKHTAELSKNILDEVNNFTDGILMPALQMLVNIISAAMVLTLLMVVDYKLSLLAILVLGGFYLLVFSLLKKKLTRISREKVQANQNRFKISSEAFGGIKDLKILHKEESFLEIYRVHSSKFAKIKAINATIQKVPQSLLEIIVFGGILVIVIYLLISTGDLAKALPIITLYGFAAIRLKPSIQTIFSSYSLLKFNYYSLEVLYHDFNEGDLVPGGLILKTDDNKRLEFKNAIHLDHISYRYPNSHENVIDDLSLTIPKNKSIAFVGATGSGKTTLIDIILGLLTHQRGRLIVDETEINNDNLIQWQNNLGYVSQQIYLLDESIESNIAFCVPPDEIDHNAVQRAAKIANLDEFISSLPDKYQTEVGERGLRISGGQRQRIGIARALYRNPDILILDEATSSLDGITEDVIIEALNNLSGSRTIIMVAHRLTTVMNCDVIYLLDKGEIVDFGTYEELLEKNKSFKSMAKV